MPTPADDILRKITLNLYEVDCAYLEKVLGRGWTIEVRNAIHEYTAKVAGEHLSRNATTDSATYKTLGDLNAK